MIKNSGLVSCQLQSSPYICFEGPSSTWIIFHEASNKNWKYYYYYYNRFTALWTLSGITRVSWYQKKHSPTHIYRAHQSSLICFIHLIRSMTSSLFNPCTWQSFSTISLQVFLGLPLGLAPSTSYSIHFFTQSLSSFRNTCPYHLSLFCCSIEIMSSNPSFFLNPFNPFTAAHTHTHNRFTAGLEYVRVHPGQQVPER